MSAEAAVSLFRRAPARSERDELNLPSDFEAERALISTCASAGATGGTRLDALILATPPGIFLAFDHQAVWWALQQLIRNQVEVNSITLKDALEQSGELGRVGGYSGLVELLSAEEVGNPEHLVDRLRELHTRRKAMRAASEIIRRAADLVEPFGGLQSLLQEWFEDLSISGRKDDPLEISDPADWLDSTPPAVRFLLEGLLPLGEPAILAAKSNAGKSLIALQVSIATATGRGLWGLHGAPAPLQVLFLEMEDSKEELQRRLQRAVDLFREETDWGPADDEMLRANLHFLTPRWKSQQPKNLVAMTPFLLGKAAALTRDGAQLGLLVLDTFAALSPGKEVDAETHAPFWASCFNIRDTTGAALLVCHHYRKMSDGLGLYERLSFDQVRGSTAIVAGARAVLQVEPLSPKEAARVGLDEERAAAGNYLALGLTKFNAGPKASCRLLEQRQAGETGGGFFTLHPDSERICATLRSKGALAKLDKTQAVFMDMVNGLERKAIAKKHWPDASTDKQRDGRMRDTVYRLKKELKWLQADGQTPTDIGMAKVLEFRRVETVSPDAQPREALS
jgi:hypothetical protein